ncbi:MAG: CPBP family intramembrane metalloprotease [Moraxella sp.]|nr:CPBP family intramembrane metalloprotease [Moraxella sp.]
MSTHSNKTWSYGQAAAYLFLLLLVFFGVQLGAFLLLAGLSDSVAKLSLWATLITAFFMMGLCFLLVRGLVKDDMARLLGRFHGDTLNAGLFWQGLGLLLLFFGLSEGLGRLLDKTPMDFMAEFIEGNPLWLVLFLTVIVAPVYEELLFRGVVFGLIAHANPKKIHTAPSRRQLVLASVISSVLFAVVHLQYDWFGFGLIFLLALLFCYLRVRSGSLVLPILFHMLNNAAAMAVYLFWGVS